MKSPNITTYIFLICSVLVSSCEKNTSYEIEQHVRISNNTDYFIDSISIYSNVSFGSPKSLYFSNIEPDFKTEFQSILNMQYDNSISILLNDTIIKRSWEMPYAGDATQPGGINAIWPPGKYTFGIIATDSQMNSIFIVLEEYKKEGL